MLLNISCVNGRPLNSDAGRPTHQPRMNSVRTLITAAAMSLQLPAAIAAESRKDLEELDQVEASDQDWSHRSCAKPSLKPRIDSMKDTTNAICATWFGSIRS